MNDFKDYRKKNVQAMRPYVPGEDLTGISVNAEDTPEEGGMIAVNAENEADKWYVGKTFFEKNYELWHSRIQNGLWAKKEENMRDEVNYAKPEARQDLLEEQVRHLREQIGEIQNRIDQLMRHEHGQRGVTFPALSW